MQSPSPRAPLVESSVAKSPATQTAVGVSGGPSTKSSYFEFVEGTSSKFWEATQSGNSMTVRWGRIGSTGQSKTKTLQPRYRAVAQTCSLSLFALPGGDIVVIGNDKSRRRLHIVNLYLIR
jgi:hypothetical protein